MPQFLVDAQSLKESFVYLEGEEAHHAMHVMRLKTGETINLFDGQGHGAQGVIDVEEKKRIGIRIECRYEATQKNSFDITLAPALLPHDTFEELLWSSTELGVKRLIPLKTRRSIVRLGGAKEAGKADHWRRVLVAACKQCGRLDIPEVSQPADLSALDFSNFDLILVAHPSAQTPWPAVAGRLQSAKHLLAVVGPEGGLDEREISDLDARGAVGVNLGPHILRSPTAVTALLALLNVRF